MGVSMNPLSLLLYIQPLIDWLLALQAFLLEVGESLVKSNAKELVVYDPTELFAHEPHEVPKHKASEEIDGVVSPCENEQEAEADDCYHLSYG